MTAPLEPSVSSWWTNVKNGDAFLKLCNSPKTNEWLERWEMETVNNYQRLMVGRSPIVHCSLANVLRRIGNREKVEWLLTIFDMLKEFYSSRVRNHVKLEKETWKEIMSKFSWPSSLWFEYAIEQFGIFHWDWNEVRAISPNLKRAMVESNKNIDFPVGCSGSLLHSEAPSAFAYYESAFIWQWLQ